MFKRLPPRKQTNHNTSVEIGISGEQWGVGGRGGEEGGGLPTEAPLSGPRPSREICCVSGTIDVFFTNDTSFYRKHFTLSSNNIISNVLITLESE